MHTYCKDLLNLYFFTEGEHRGTENTFARRAGVSQQSHKNNSKNKFFSDQISEWIIPMLGFYTSFFPQVLWNRIKPDFQIKRIDC